MNANKYITIAIGVYITITDNYRDMIPGDFGHVDLKLK